MTESHLVDPPSPFVATWARTLLDRIPASRRALDIAMGRGRHALALASHGFTVFGVDIKHDAVRSAVTTARERGYQLHGWCADLSVSRLPANAFDLIVVTRYLQRDLFPSLSRALTPGGAILYETFTEAQLSLGWGPKSPDHLLKEGELRSSFAELELLFYEEIVEPEAVARLAACKRTSRS